ncbi:MAG: glycosyltransferase family 4 protein [Candidatus Andersenbacteria bacterium]|nr:glycosyltransferase family 4 protein [Candidatus Andersenbacteria bacterium]
MRIAIDVRCLMEGRLSGVEQYAVQIIRGMLRVAPRHEYVLFYNSAKEVILPDFYGDVEIKGSQYPNKAFNALQWAVSSPKWDTVVGADVFFAPNLGLLPLKAETPLVVVAHDLAFERFPEFLDMRRRTWHTMMNPRSLMKRADQVIAVSEHTKQDLLDLYGLPEGRVSVVHSGVQNHRLPDAKQVARVRAKYHLPEKFLLYVGAHEPRKNIPGLIRAYQAIRSQVGHDLVIAGEKGWQAGALKKVMATPAQRERIHMMGFVEEEDKAALYTAADLFVYPSFYEGFGFPPLEALMAGTPVITSFNSALPEVVGQWATLVDPHNPAELAGVMKELLHDLPEVTEGMRREIAETYSWDEAALKTLEVLQAVV